MALIPNPRPDVYGGVRGRGRLGHRVHAAGHAASRAITSSASRSARPRVFATLEDGVPAETVKRLYPRLIAGIARSDRRVTSSTRRSATSAPRPTTCRRRWSSPAAEGDRLVSGIGDRRSIRRRAARERPSGMMSTIGANARARRLHRLRRRRSCPRRALPPLCDWCRYGGQPLRDGRAASRATSLIRRSERRVPAAFGRAG